MKKGLSLMGLVFTLVLTLSAWEAPVQIRDNRAGGNDFTQVRFDSTQTAYILYTAGNDVMLARYDGETVQVVGEVGDSELASYTPWMFIDADDVVHIVWAEASEKLSNDYFIRYRTFKGTEFSPVSTIIKLVINGRMIHPSQPAKTDPLRMTMDKKGNMFIVFMDATKYKARFISKYGDGVKFENFPVEGKSKFPDVAVDENYIHVTWQAGVGANNPDGGYTVFWGRRENKIDGAWLSPVDIKEGKNWENSAHWPLVTQDGSGKLHFLWQDDGEPRARVIFYKYWDGEAFHARENVSGLKPGFFSNNSLRVQDENNMFVAGHRREVFSLYAWKRNGVWSAYEPIPNVSNLAPDSECADVDRSFKVAVVSFSSHFAVPYVVASSRFKATQRPVAVISADKDAVFTGETVNFDAGQSHDPDGSIVRYVWDFADGETVEGSHPSHVFLTNYGVVSVKLTVYDNRGAIGVAYKNMTVKTLYTANATCERKRIRTILYNRFAYDITWTNNPKNEQAGYTIVSYKIFRKEVGGTEYSEIGQVSATRRAYADMTIEQSGNKEYVYAVCPVDDQGHVSPVDNF